MAYYRRRRYRKRRRKRKGIGMGKVIGRAANGLYKHYRTSYPWLVKSVNWMKYILNSEKKLLDTGGSGVQINVEAYTCLNQITQGDTSSSRNGNSIKATSLLSNISIQYNSAGAAFQRMRIIVFVDTDNQGSAPTSGDVLQTAAGMVSPLHGTNNLGRFTILYDTVVTVSADKPNVQFKKFNKLDFHIKFDGVNATDFDKNSVFMLNFSDAATNAPTIEWNHRLRYYDN